MSPVFPTLAPATLRLALEEATGTIYGTSAADETAMAEHVQQLLASGTAENINALADSVARQLGAPCILDATIRPGGVKLRRVQARPRSAGSILDDAAE